MSNETFYCYNCGEYTMVKDDDGYFTCTNCHMDIEEEMYDEMNDSDFERFIDVYPEVYNSKGDIIECPYCGNPIKEKPDGTYICSGSNCCYDPNMDPDLFVED